MAESWRPVLDRGHFWPEQAERIGTPAGSHGTSPSEGAEPRHPSLHHLDGKPGELVDRNVLRGPRRLSRAPLLDAVRQRSSRLPQVDTTYWEHNPGSRERLPNQAA